MVTIWCRSIDPKTAGAKYCGERLSKIGGSPVGACRMMIQLQSIPDLIFRSLCSVYTALWLIAVLTRVNCRGTENLANLVEVKLSISLTCLHCIAAVVMLSMVIFVMWICDLWWFILILVFTISYIPERICVQCISQPITNKLVGWRRVNSVHASFAIGRCMRSTYVPL